MKRVIGIVVLSGILFGFQWFFCTTVAPEESDDGEFTILRLSLEENGRKTAEFSGAPIEAIIELDKDTTFNYLNWHTGQGDPIFNDSILDTKGKKFSIELYWMQYPLYKDTSDDHYYDTVWVSMGGGLKKSNKVYVKVTNLPIVIDSVHFDSLYLLGQDTIWNCSLPDQLDSSYLIHVYARDLDADVPNIQILGSKGTIIQKTTASLDMEYVPPKGDFIDTVSLVVYDQEGAQTIRKMVLKHITPNIFPFIDSIRIQSTMLRGSPASGGTYRVGFVAFDTLRCVVYAHDSLGSITTVRWRSDNNLLEPDSTSLFRATYICTTECSDTLSDSSRVIDNIVITVIDNRGDSTIRTVELSQGTINMAPSILLLSFDGEPIIFSDTLGIVNTTGGIRHMFQLETSDPEGDSLKIGWSATPSTRLTAKTDTSALYSAPSANDTDIVKVTVNDGELTVFKTIKIIITDIVPSFESFSVNDTLLRGNDTVFTLEVNPRDTLVLIANFLDRDDTDSMTYQWEAGKPDRFSLTVENRAKYILPDTDLNDTIVAIVSDGTEQIIRKIACVKESKVPVVDSITHDGVRLGGMTAFVWDTGKAGDTIQYEVFARDPEGDDLTYTWSASDTGQLSSTKEKKITYTCVDSSFIDTVSVKVMDTVNKFVEKKILLVIDTVTAP